MVAHEPGDWWEQALDALARQTYRGLTVVVLAPPHDPGRPDDRERRLRAILPRAVYRPLAANVGFGPACNEVLTSVQGASFFLFLHDDVRLDPDAIQALVDEAVRSNAGVVGPKLVDWDDPDRLRQVGMGSDKFGAASPLVEPGELDQAQHDAVRDCFYVPGGATLVRADLFGTLGGFDPGIDLLGEDLDLCWRAHVAGARVLVAPAARAAHREALDDRPGTRPGGVAAAAGYRRRAARRHRLRTILSCYGRVHRWRVLPQLLLVSLVEALVSLAIGQLDRASDALAVWPAVTGRGGVRRRRSAVRALRAVSDGEVRAMQVRGSAGANRFVRGQLDDTTGGLTLAGALAQLNERARSRTARPTIVVLGLVLVVALFGSRDLLRSPIPAVGQFVPFELGPFELLSAWAGGDPAGLGGPGPNPSGLGFLGFTGVGLLGAMGFVRRLLIVGLLPLGGFGMWRLARPAGPARARLVGLTVYLALPLAANAIAAGRWGPLAVWAFSPWIVLQLARAAQLSPYRPDWVTVDDPPSGRIVWNRALAVALLTALAAAIEPFAIVLTAIVALALAFGAVLSGQTAAAGRFVRAGLAGAAGAFVLHLPWSLGLVAGGWADTSGTAATVWPVLGAGQILRFATGPVGDSPLVWAVLLAAVLPLLIGRRWRLGWALQAWALAVVGFALAWVGGRGWLSGLLPAPEVVLAPAAVAVALAAGMGAAAIERDLRHFDFGWHQVAAAVVAAASVIGVLPIAGASTDGRWGMTRGDFRPFIASLESPTEDFRALWIGDASVMPLRGWPLDAPSLAEPEPGRRLVYATTTGRLPDVRNAWPGSREGATEALTDLLEGAAASGTNRLGASLAPLDIEYVIVPLRPAPVPFVAEDVSSPDALIDLLATQLDLLRIDVVDGVQVFRNTAWEPSRATGASAEPSSTDSLLRPVQLVAWLVVLVALWVTRARRRPDRGDTDASAPPPPEPAGRAPESGPTGRAPESGRTGRAPESGATGRAPESGSTGLDLRKRPEPDPTTAGWEGHR